MKILKQRELRQNFDFGTKTEKRLQKLQIPALIVKIMGVTSMHNTIHCRDVFCLLNFIGINHHVSV